MAGKPGVSGIDPESWGVTILSLPKRFTRGTALGFCGEASQSLPLRRRLRGHPPTPTFGWSGPRSPRTTSPAARPLRRMDSGWQMIQRRRVVRLIFVSKFRCKSAVPGSD